MGRTFWREWGYAFTLAALSLFVRLYDLGSAPYTTDEPFWIARSSTFQNELVRDPTHAADHLSHPGIPPSALMGAAQWVARASNARRGAIPGSPGYVFDYDASRAVIAAFSALVVPALFLGLRGLLARPIRLAASALLAVEPHHAGYSRMAHVDTILTLLVTCTALAAFHRFRNRRSRGGAVTGVAWGLALATKYTAALAVPAVFASKLAYGVRSLRVSGWMIESVMIGQLVLILLYTRLWHYPSVYVTDYGMRSKAAGTLYRFLSGLSEELVVVTGLLIVSIVIVIALRRRGGKVPPWADLKLLIPAAAVVAVAAILPAAAPNLLYFWQRAAGLRNVVHHTIVTGAARPPPAYGYGGFLMTCFPDLLLVGLGLAVVQLLRSATSRTWNSQARLAAAAIIFSACWIAILSASSKQYWRYALPVVPLLITASTWGYWFSLRLLRPAIAAQVLCGVVGIQAAVLVSVHPLYHLYRTAVSGGLTGALERGDGLGTFADRRVSELLVEASADMGGRLYVYYPENIPSIERAVRKFYPRVPHGRYVFGKLPWADCDLFLLPEPKSRFFDPSTLNELLPRLEEVGRYELAGTRILGVYRPRNPSPDTDRSISSRPPRPEGAA